MNVPPGIPILGADKTKGEDPKDQVLEGIKVQKLKVGTTSIPVDVKDGKPVVGKVTELTIAVQFKFVLKIPLPMADQAEGAQLMQMVMNEGLQPEWKRTHDSLRQMQSNLEIAAEKAVKAEYLARKAAGKQP